MQFELQQHGGLAARQDHEDAGERDQHAGDLPRRRVFALDHPGTQQHEERHRRIEQHRVHRQSTAQAQVDQALEQRHAGEGEQQQDARVAPDERALAPDRGQGEGRKHDRGDGPAPEIHRHRVEGVAQRAAGDPVAGPEQVRKREQQERGKA